MDHYGPRMATTTPRTLEKQHEVMEALRALAAQNDEQLRRRRADIAVLRRDLEALRHECGLLAQTLPRMCCDQAIADVRAYFRKYSPDQPRVPAGNPDGGEWTGQDEGESSNDLSVGAGDVADSGSAESPSDIFDPNDEAQYADLDTGTRTDATTEPNILDNPGERYAANGGDHGAVNDNLTPEQTCRDAYAEGLARLRIIPGVTPNQYLDERYQLTSALQLCLDRAGGLRPVSPNGDRIWFYGAGVVIFKPGLPPRYVRVQGRP